MAQLNWTYTSDRGARYNVGMYHGAESGHFLVHCNSKVILIDFHVKKSSTYSFFIENELMEIKISANEKEGYSYDFVINTEVETPKNEERKKFNNKQFVWGIAGFVAFALLVFGCYRALDARHDWYLKNNKAALLLGKGMETTARVAVTPLDEQELRMTYSFIADGHPREFQQNISILQAGVMPVRSGDQFKLTFLPDHPEIHELHLLQPQKKTLDRFSELVFNKMLALHPGLSEEEVSCIIQSTVRAAGMPGLAHLFYQELPQEAHPGHNRKTFEDFRQSEAFLAAIKKECPELEW